MLANFEQSLEKYAEVVVKIGLNIQPGQRIMLSAPIEAAPLVRHLTACAYQNGARFVSVNFVDEQLARIRLQYAADDTLTEFPTYRTKGEVEYLENGDALLYVYGSSPGLLSDIDPAKVSKVMQVNLENISERRALTQKFASTWLIVGAAAPGWATTVFPDLPEAQAADKLWEAIFATCRVDQPDPVAAWKAHLAELAARRDYLNAKQYDALKYTAPGTDLTLGLPQNHIWNGGQVESQRDVIFVPNLPTEEVFTLPHRERIDGHITMTKPLSLGGQVVEELVVTFKDGRIVEAKADKGQQMIDSTLNIDDGGRSLGEIALVPHSSPISQSGILFFNTLYDENASCHLAIGSAYRFSVEGGKQMTDEEFMAVGGNVSRTHVDFMVGSGQLNIDGLNADGSSEPVMRDGEWAFDV